ncbi:hypothetical protein [Nocardioides nanhaiensis]|uniref:Secreted protein n=1 Tax=Nocardioides nanhaiensis TaxID=1476871 RepID=A0ABP8X3K4_9ACTN
MPALTARLRNRPAARRWLLTAATGALGATLLTAVPAHADGVRLTDPADATASLADVREVTLRHTARRVVVVVRVTDLRRSARSGPAGAAVFYDTNRSVAGPEWRLTTGLHDGTDYQLVRSRGWNGTVGEPSSCGYRVRLDYAADTMTSWVARRCLGNPPRVRVGVHVVDQHDPSHPVEDWLGAARSWTPAFAPG